MSASFGGHCADGYAAAAGYAGASAVGAGPFSYEKVVQPVWDAACVRCHDGDKTQTDLTGVLDANGVPASQTLITQGWVHYFDYNWGQEHFKAEPLTFGTVKSRLWEVLDGGTTMSI